MTDFSVAAVAPSTTPLPTQRPKKLPPAREVVVRSIAQAIFGPFAVSPAACGGTPTENRNPNDTGNNGNTPVVGEPGNGTPPGDLENADCESGRYTICTVLDSHDPTTWVRADGWTNGPPFNAGWQGDNVKFEGGDMEIVIDDEGCPDSCSGMPYASGEYRTLGFYGYGMVETRMQVPEGDGTVAGSLFFYTGPSDGNRHDETDMEILGSDTTSMQTNYYTDGIGGHETHVQLDFDASEDFHTYGIEWRENAIHWYVDGVRVHTENGSRGELPSVPGCIKMNAWPGIGVDGWLGPFNYAGPRKTKYQWIRYRE